MPVEATCPWEKVGTDMLTWDDNEYFLMLSANGKAESGVKAAKHLMEVCKRSQTDPFMAMLEVSNTRSWL